MRFQEGHESLNHDLNRGYRLLQRWNKSFSAENPRIDDRLIDSEFHVLIRFRLEKAVEEFVALFEPVQARMVRPREEAVLADRDEETMLVNVIRLMEKPEPILPTLVRFETVDMTNRYGMNEALYLSASLGYVVRKVPPYREPKSGRFAKVNVGMSDFSKLVDNMVEGTSKVLEDIPGDRENLERRRLQRCEISRLLPGLLIEVGSNYCRVFTPEFLRPRLKIIEMMLGPIGLHPDTENALKST